MRCDYAPTTAMVRYAYQQLGDTDDLDYMVTSGREFDRWLVVARPPLLKPTDVYMMSEDEQYARLEESWLDGNLDNKQASYVAGIIWLTCRARFLKPE